MEYQLIRSRRKTIAICIGCDGAVVVRAPFRAAQKTIDHFVQEKQSWIAEKSKQMAENEAARRNFSVTSGSALWLFGREYPVVYGDGVTFDGTHFVITDEAFESLRPQLVRLYRAIAAKVILERVAYYSGRTGLTPSGVRIGSANTCWGSCSGKDRLNFTWKLIMTPLEEIDYVAVHELAHIKEHNHSPRFWRLVEDILPDYRIRREKLRQFGKNLQKQKWDS